VGERGDLEHTMPVLRPAPSRSASASIEHDDWQGAVGLLHRPQQSMSSTATRPPFHAPRSQIGQHQEISATRSDAMTGVVDQRDAARGETPAQQRIGDQRHIVAGGIEHAPGATAGIADDQRNPPVLFQRFTMASPVKLLLVVRSSASVAARSLV
jgi:hypothetical protein